MTRDEVIAYCLSKPSAWQDFPFDESTLVVKISERMFALLGLDGAVPAVSLRCSPAGVLEWRQRYPDSVGPAPYMKAKPWNLVLLDGSVDDDDMVEMIDLSYDSAITTLPKYKRPPGWQPGA